MTKASEDEQRNLQSDLDQEQAVVDLDQGIADREQARVDREQEPLDAATAALATAEPAPDGESRTRAERGVDIGLQQDRQDAHQAQIDQTQLAQGVRQDVLDQQQVELDATPSAGSDEADQARAGEELQEALRLRAKEALIRAEAARQRAAETLLRLDAAHARHVQRRDRRD